MGLGIGLLGLGMSAFSAVQGIQEAKANKKYAEAQQAALNKRAAYQNELSRLESEKGEQEARRRYLQLAERQAGNRVGFAGKGLLVDGGEMQAALYDTNAENARADVENIVRNAKTAQDAYDWNAAEYRAQGEQLVANAKAAEKSALWSGLIKVGSSALGFGLKYPAMGFADEATELADAAAAVKRGENYLDLGLSEGAEAKIKSIWDSGVTSNADFAQRLQTESQLLYGQSSFIQGAGSFFSGIGGGQVGQSIYNTSYGLDSANKTFTRLTGQRTPSTWGTLSDGMSKIPYFGKVWDTGANSFEWVGKKAQGGVGWLGDNTWRKLFN